MNTTDPTKRILTEFGEAEQFFGFTLGDLKLLVPTAFVAMLIVGNPLAGFRFIGWGAGVLLVLGTLVLIFASPEHRSTDAWVLARLRFLLNPPELTLAGDEIEGARESSKDLSPEIDDARAVADASAIQRAAVMVPDLSETDTQELTEIAEFHVAQRAGERRDGYVYGAVRIDPANMALATPARWERAASRLGAVLNRIEFPLQIYSTEAPVDPTRIIDGYRNRRDDENGGLTPELERLIETYVSRFPREFERRGTSVREFYVIVPVSVLDIQDGLASKGQDGLLQNLERLPYVGGFFTTLRARRRDLSAAQLKIKQLGELDHRLTIVEDEFSGLAGCETKRVEASALAGLLRDFWNPSAPSDGDSSLLLRTMPAMIGGNTRSSESGGGPHE